MKLLDLDPRWLQVGNRKVGFVFKCPHCRTTYLSCFFERFPVLTGDGAAHPSQFDLFERFLPVVDAHQVVPSDTNAKWTRTGDDFATMSVMPSINAAASGHWHGFITGGEAK